MKKLLLMMLGVAMAFPAISQDFQYEYMGQTLTYTVIDEEAKTCRTRNGAYGTDPGNYVNGPLVIPAEANGYAVVEIGKSGFVFCRGLTSVTIPSTVTLIADNAFHSCDHLIEILVEDGNPSYRSDDGVLFNKDMTELLQFPNGRSGDYIIPSTVVSIANDAFSSSSHLTSVIMPDSVEEMGIWTFAWCSELKSVTLSSSLPSIRYSAFRSCTNLETIDIPSSVTTIYSDAFLDCKGLKSVSLPGSLTDIRASVFVRVNSLEEVYYNCTDPLEVEDPEENHVFSEYSGQAYDPVDAVLYVPAEAVEKCKVTYPWKLFYDIRAHEFPSGVEKIEADIDVDMPVEIFTVNGVKADGSLNTLVSGLYIVRQNGTVKKIIVK